MVEYPDEPDKNTCEIANTVLTFEDMQKEYEDTLKTVNNITSSNGTISEGAIKGTVEKITIKKADIESLNAVEMRVGDLEATSATITQLDVANANIADLQANKANITELNAGVGRIDILESSVGDIKTLVNGNLTSDNIQSLILTSDKVTVDNGFIKNAMIDNLDVSKIKAGDISTNKFKIKSDNGGIEIVGATQQFKDKNNRVRIQMGQDALGNFNFILRGEDGTTTLIDHTGIKEKAIANDLIKGNMISENAVGGKQVDYNSFTEEFNKDTNTHTLKSSKVLLDKNNQTLDIAFNQLDTKVDSAPPSITTDSSITKLDGAIDGMLKLNSIKGRTLQNLFKPSFDIIAGSGGAYWYFNNIHSIQDLSNKVITLINPTPREIRFNVHDLNDTFVTFYNIPALTVKVMTFEASRRVKAVIGFADKGWTEANKTELKGMIPEGDWTNKEVPYFEGIRSVGENGENLELVSCGKNLLNGVVEDKEYTTTGTSSPVILTDYIKVDKDKNYILSAYIKDELPHTDTTGSGILRLDIYNSAKVLITNIGVKGTVTKEYTRMNSDVISLPSEAKYIRLNFRHANGSVGTIKNAQLEEGTIATTYEPYQEHRQPISLTEPLRCLPNGIRDIVDFEKGVVVKNVGKVVLNGSEIWRYTSSGANEHIYVTVPGCKEGHGQYLVCDRFSNSRVSWPLAPPNTVTTSSSTTGQIGFNFLIGTYTLETWKAYLKANPVTVYYQLAIPVEESINVEQYMKQFKDGYFNIDGSLINPTTELEYSTSLASALSTMKEVTESNTTSLNIQQGKISALISNTTIVKDGQTIQLKDSYNSTVATVNSINNVISSHTSTIDALTGQVLGVETKTNEVKRDLDGTVATVSGHTTSINGLNSTVNTQSSSISQLQNSIKLKVESTEVTNIVNGAIDGIEVGGRNLFYNSKFDENTNKWASAATIVEKDGFKCAKISSTSFKATQTNCQSILGKVITGETYTMSGWVKTQNIIKGTTNYTIMFYLDGQYNNNGTSSWYGIGSKELAPNHDWTLIKYTFTVPEKYSLATSATAFVYCRDFTGDVYFKELKLEKGNKATDWTPAPEDTQEQITSVSKRTATIETNLTGITSRVSSVEQTTSTIGGNVTSLQTRMSTAEQKITDSAIISTVSNTFISKEDASITYATKASMTLTESQLRLDFSASGGYNYYLRKCYTARLTGTATIYQDSVDGFDERCKGTRIVAPALFESRFQKVIPKNGTYSISFYAKANNGNYPTVQVQLCDKVAGEVYITNVWKLFKIENVTISNWSDIYSFMDIRVNSNYYWDFTLSHICINDGPVALPWSPNATEIYQGSTQIDANGVTIYNGAIDVRNRAGASVLKGDANGDLMVRGNLYADPANPILHLFEGCSLDATYNNEQGIGSAVRLKWNASNYVYVSTNDVSIFQNGNRYYEFTPGYLSIVPSTTYFANQCKIDASGGTFRFYVSKTTDTGIRILGDGTVSFLVNGTAKHVFYPGGTKAGGTIEVDGVNLGMSPIDSPKVLLEDVLFDIDIQEEGTTVVLDSTFLKTISTYAVFCSNHNVNIVSKDRTSFAVRGYTGKVDFRVIGYRIGYEEQYYQVVS